jgi:hypothetical protein
VSKLLHFGLARPNESQTSFDKRTCFVVEKPQSKDLEARFMEAKGEQEFGQEDAPKPTSRELLHELEEAVHTTDVAIERLNSTEKEGE